MPTTRKRRRRDARRGTVGDRSNLNMRQIAASASIESDGFTAVAAVVALAMVELVTSFAAWRTQRRAMRCARSRA
jgi:hypothetical protein